MSVDCELVQILLKKLGYLEKRVTYLEGKSRNQQVVIETLRKKLRKLKRTTRNKGKVSQEKLVAGIKPELIEEIESTHNDTLKIKKNDPKISQKLVIQMGIRIDEESRRIINNAEITVENGHASKRSQIKTEITQQDSKIEKISSKPKRSVKKSQVCSFCSKSFPSFSHLSVHMRVHTGERPFKCQICSNSFKQLADLKKHNLVHTGEKPFSCSVCSKSFTRNGSLSCHMRIHTGERPFSCSVCSRAFTCNFTLKSHMRVHTGEKPYSCSFCFKTFAQSTTRNDHIRSHLGEKPYKCLICSKSFTQSTHLLTHKKKIHKGEK